MCGVKSLHQRMKRIALLILSPFLFLTSLGREISGIVVDSSTGEALVGASVYVKQQPRSGTSTGLDGSFKLTTDFKNPILICSWLDNRIFVDAAYYTPCSDIDGLSSKANKDLETDCTFPESRVDRRRFIRTEIKNVRICRSERHCGSSQGIPCNQRECRRL